MGKTRIKICGIRDVEAGAVAAEAGAQWIGLVFVEASPRFVTVSQARQVVSHLPDSVEPVGLFVDAPLGEIKQVAAEAGLSTVQLHGKETPDDVRALAPLQVIKALAFESGEVGEVGDGQRIFGPWADAAAKLDNLRAILFDAPPLPNPPDDSDGGLAGGSAGGLPGGSAGGLPGGSGRRFDWAALAQARDQGLLEGLPDIFLAGGLTPENVGQAIAQVRPYGVDVSSGVEASRGVKDAQRIRAFCAAVRAADEA